MNDIQIEIGKKIKKIREKKLNISQKDFALKINLDPTYVSRDESGKQNLTIDTLEQICNALNMTLKEFFDYE